MLFLHFQVFVRKGEDTGSILDEVDVVLSVAIWYFLQVLLNDFWRSFAEYSEGSAPGDAVLNMNNGRLPLQRGLEEESLDLHDLWVRSYFWFTRAHSIVLEVDSLEGLLFDGITDKVSLSHGEGVAASENNLSLLAVLVHVRELKDLLLNGLVVLLRSPGDDVGEVDGRHAFDDQIVAGQRACLIEAANVYFACVWYPERLGAEDLLLDQSENRVVDRQRELHWKLWWHDVGDDEHAAEHDLVPAPVDVFEAFHHYMVAGDEREHKQDQQVPVHLRVLHCHTIRAEKYHSHQLALLGLEAVLQDVGAYSIFDWRLGKLRQVLCHTKRYVLQYFCTAVENVLLVDSLDLECVFDFVDVGNALFDERLRLAGKDSLVDDGRAREEDHVARNVVLLYILGPMEKHYVTRVKVISHRLLPFAESVHPDLLWRLPH